MTDDFLDIDSTTARDSMRDEGVEFAKLYLSAFVHNVAGAKLLQHWDETLVRKRVPVNAPHTEYAAVEAVRDFVNGIRAQIKLAQTEGR